MPSACRICESEFGTRQLLDMANPMPKSLSTLTLVWHPQHLRTLRAKFKGNIMCERPEAADAQKKRWRQRKPGLHARGENQMKDRDSLHLSSKSTVPRLPRARDRRLIRKLIHRICLGWVDVNADAVCQCGCEQ